MKKRPQKGGRVRSRWSPGHRGRVTAYVGARFVVKWDKVPGEHVYEVWDLEVLSVLEHLAEAAR